MDKKKTALLITTALFALSVTGCSGNKTPEEGEEIPDTPYVDVDQEKANVVIAMIDTLTDSSTAEEVEAVEAAYNDLTTRQKNLVTNYDKLEAQMKRIHTDEDVAEVIALIDALDVENPSYDDVVKARKKYDALLVNYGSAVQARVPSAYVKKLESCEAIVYGSTLSVLFAEANDIGLDSDEGRVRFTLLSQRIEKEASLLSSAVLEKISGYSEYAAKKAEADELASFVTADYLQTTNGLPDGVFLSSLEEEEDENYGYVYTADYSSYNLSGGANINFGLYDVDFSAYVKIGFYVCWPVAGAITQFINNEVTAYAAPEPSNTWEMTFVEVSVSALSDPASETHGYSHIGAYFTDRSVCNVDGYAVTGIVGLKFDTKAADAAVEHVNTLIDSLDPEDPDEAVTAQAREEYDALLTEFGRETQNRISAERVAKLEDCESMVEAKETNSLIAKVLALDTSVRGNVVRFFSIGNLIEKKYAALTDAARAKVASYSAFQTAKDNLNFNPVSAFGMNYVSYSEKSDVWRTLSETGDNDVGVAQTTDLSKDNTTTTMLFFDGTKANAMDWSVYSYVGFLVKFEGATPLYADAVVSDQSVTYGTIPVSLTLMDATSNTYYIEVDGTSFHGSFTDNIYFRFYECAGLQSITVSDAIGLDTSAEEAAALNTYISEAPTTLSAANYFRDYSLVSRAVKTYQKASDLAKNNITDKDKMATLLSLYATAGCAQDASSVYASKWDYGTTAVVTSEFNEEYGYVNKAVFTGSGGTLDECSLKTVASSLDFSSVTHSIAFAIYNPLAYQVRLTIHSGYSGWLKGGEHQLAAGSWNLITLDKEVYTANNGEIDLIFGVTDKSIDGTFLITSMVEYNPASGSDSLSGISKIQGVLHG